MSIVKVSTEIMWSLSVQCHQMPLPESSVGQPNQPWYPTTSFPYRVEASTEPNVLGGKGSVVAVGSGDGAVVGGGDVLVGIGVGDVVEQDTRSIITMSRLLLRWRIFIPSQYKPVCIESV